MEFLHLDLANLTTIKASAEEFLSKETKLHVLFNNAGVMCPPQGSKTPQGYELQLGTNNIGTFMFTKLLTPILIATAREEPPSAVRVIWVASSATELGSPSPGGLAMDNLDYHNDKSAMVKYAISKVGNYFHATEFAKRYEADGVVSIFNQPWHAEFRPLPSPIGHIWIFPQKSGPSSTYFRRIHRALCWTVPRSHN